MSKHKFYVVRPFETQEGAAVPLGTPIAELDIKLDVTDYRPVLNAIAAGILSEEIPTDDGDHGDE